MDIAINRINIYLVNKYRETNCASYLVDSNLFNNSAIHLLLKNWRERKKYKQIPLGLLRWFP